MKTVTCDVETMENITWWKKMWRILIMQDKL